MMNIFPEIMNDAIFSTHEAILTSLRRTGEINKSNQKSEYWMGEEGQAILVEKLNDKAGPPTGLCAFDYTAEPKALLYAAGDAAEGEWIELELCADTGACDTVIPRKLCESIPIQPSLQSLKCMEYGFANGYTYIYIYNL